MNRDLLLTGFGIAAFIILVLLMWHFSGVDGVIAFRADMARQDGLEYSGTTWISRTEFSEVREYLNNYPDVYKFDIEDLEDDLVRVSYLFLALDGRFSYLESNPITNSLRAAYALSHVIRFVVIINGIVIILGFSKCKEEQHEDLET